MTDREAIWNKYIGKTVSESLCYIGCGSIISQDTFIINDGKPVCKICSNNLQFTSIRDFKQHYKLITPDCYLNVSDEITSEDLFNSVLKGNEISVFSSKYGYKYVLHLLLTLVSKEPEIKINYLGDNQANYECFHDCLIWSQYYDKPHESFYPYQTPFPQMPNFHIIFYPILASTMSINTDHFVSKKLEFEKFLGHKVSLILVYISDYVPTLKKQLLDISTNYICVGLQDKNIVVIIDKLNNKPCDKRLEYKYIKLFGGQKLIGPEII